MENMKIKNILQKKRIESQIEKSKPQIVEPILSEESEGCCSYFLPRCC